MSLSPEELRLKAYLSGEAYEVSGVGGGQDGAVFFIKRALSKDTVVIKVFERDAPYFTELECYRRITEHGTTKIANLTVPKFRGHNEELRIIEMGLVKPPYLLDFGKAHLDFPPDFDELTLSDSEDYFRSLFDSDEDWEWVKTAQWELESSYGIFYYDLKPANIMLRPAEG